MNRNQIVDRVNELNKASEAYYNIGQPIMSDAEFDNKLEKLRQWEEETGIVLSNSPTHNVGATVLDNIKEVTHKTPMLSLEKCHSTEEIVKFANNHNLVASVKLDGLTVRLTYKDGDLILAESRGNGTVGSDVTEHVKQFTNVLLHINKEGTYIIDGEALIKVDDFAEINKNEEYKNSRNLAAGTLSSLDTSVVKDRKLSWYAWEVVEGDSDNSFYKRLLNAQNLGFDVVPCYDITINEFNQLQIHIDNFINIAETENLPQDGVVFKFDDITYGKLLGNTGHHFRNGIAYKIFNDSVETTLRDIKWSCGKTGVLTPVAIFDTVDIEGSEVGRASLHNVSVMNEILGRSWKGQKIGVYKANMIIPAIRWAEQFDSSKFDDLVLDVSYINIPDKCPICGQSTKIIKDNNSELLVCTNDNCKGKLLGKLIHAASKNALNIDGLSESTIEKFINLGWLNSIKDIYHLSDHENEIKTLNGFGKKSVEKLLLSIEKSRNTSLERFIYSLSIPSIGKSVSKDISKLCEENFNNFIALMKSSPEKLLTINGFGVVMMNSMAKWWHENSLWVYDLSKEFTFEKSKSVSNETSNTLQGKTFVVTGSVNHYKNRDELKTDIVAHGGTVVGSVSSKTNYLINNDINSTSSKNKKAKSLNIPIITENEFIKMLHNS